MSHGTSLHHNLNVPERVSDLDLTKSFKAPFWSAWVIRLAAFHAQECDKPLERCSLWPETYGTRILLPCVEVPMLYVDEDVGENEDVDVDEDVDVEVEAVEAVEEVEEEVESLYMLESLRVRIRL